MAAEQIFSSATLGLIVPNTVLNLPETVIVHDGDPWLEKLRRGEREKVFYDERLDFFLTLHLREPTAEKSAPSKSLLTFLNHLQVALDTSYISPVPQSSPSGGRLPPLRTSSLAPGSQTLSTPIPIFTPQTPRPTPSASELDEKYSFSEGTPLRSFIWGDADDPFEDEDAFRLLWSEHDGAWVGLYRLSVIVSYLRTGFPNPLICLTATVTLRDKPLTATPKRRLLAELITAVGDLPSLSKMSEPIHGGSDVENNDLESGEAARLYEVNLLDGLATDGSERLYLPSTRLGDTIRHEDYSLPPLTPTSPIHRKASPSRTVPILRRSFRKTLGAVSGIQVRMRTVFVPHIYIPEDVSDERGSHEAANEERTVVLCLEVENTGESAMGFAVESIDVNISGDDAKIRLIGWGTASFSDSSNVLPLYIDADDRYDLLYAASFLRPAELSELEFMPTKDLNEANSEYQRSVAISVTGRPFEGADRIVSGTTRATPSFPTNSFLSRWNCVLDLSPRHDHDLLADVMDEAQTSRVALPYPPSPFPPPSPKAKTVREQVMALSASQPIATAGLKRHTYAGSSTSRLTLDSNRASLGVFQGSFQGSRDSLTPGARTPTSRADSGRWRTESTFSQGALSPPLPALPLGPHTPPPRTATAQTFATPPTPVYPPFSSGPPTARPTSMLPSLGPSSGVGPSVEGRRERMHQLGVPQTPDPRVWAPSGAPSGDTNSADLIVSVSLRALGESQSTPQSPLSTKRIYPLEEFALELFAFNQSPATRTFEVSYPDTARQRGEQRFLLHSAGTQLASPGFMPLESNVRIGPLGPSTCQSVRMRFLAMYPGIHSVDTLTITDIHTGVSVNLRSVMDFAVLKRTSA